MLQIFPEFKIIMDSTNIHTLPVSTYESLKHLFHKKVFGTIDNIKEKYKEFDKLYDIENGIKISTSKTDMCKKEEERIREYLEWHYTISGDKEKRMRANELYTELLNHLCILDKDRALCKKRIASHLLNLKLQKKRFSDGYYYYGIEKKKIVDISINEIEKHRTKDLQEWTKIVEIPDRNNDIINKYNNLVSALKDTFDVKSL